MVQLADMYLDARLQQNVTKDRKFKDSGYKKPQEEWNMEQTDRWTNEHKIVQQIVGESQ